MLKIRADARLRPVPWLARLDDGRRPARRRGSARSPASGPPAIGGTSSVPSTTPASPRPDVAAFWARQDFDLELPNVDGHTPHGNCDLLLLEAGPGRSPR